MGIDSSCGGIKYPGRKPVIVLVESRGGIWDKQSENMKLILREQAQSQAGLGVCVVLLLTGSLLGGFGDATLNSARYFRK